MSLRFDFIGIVTTDLAASLAFYRLLGLEIPTDQDEASHVEVDLPGGMRIAWDPISTIHSFDPTFEVPTGQGRIAFAFQAGAPAEVDEAYAQVLEAGYRGRTEPWDTPWGQRYATVFDPDGNTVDIYAPLDAQ